MYRGLSAKYTVVLEKDGEVVFDQQLASILEEIEKRGSILSASKTLGIPYSRTWELLSRTEKILGVKLVETKKGGVKRGGTTITKEARELLRKYNEALARLERCIGVEVAPRKTVAPREPSLVVAYSHDPLLELLVESLRDKRQAIEAACIGSGLSVAMLSLGEADIACIHLFDPETKTYNKPYLERYWVYDPVLLGGYKRQLVFIYRKELKYTSWEEIVLDILSGKLRLANRNRGSGTRIYLDYILEEIAKKYNIRDKKIIGYSREYWTHSEVAREVALGRADTGLVLRSVAEKYGLPWIHSTWENYECYTVPSKKNLALVESFREKISSEWFLHLLESAIGYKPLE